MEVLPETFISASISGLWEPVHWRSKVAKRMYRVYSLFLVSSMYLLMISQTISLIFQTKSVDDLAEACFVYLTGVNATIKSLNMLLRKECIINLANMMSNEQCIPKTAEEIRLCSFFNMINRYMVLFGMTLAEFTAACLAVWPLFFSAEKYPLSLRAWYPYEISDGATYWTSQIHQMIALLTMAGWNASNDLFAVGFMIQTCSQLELIHHRIQTLPKTVKRAVARDISQSSIRNYECKVLKQAVCHHLLIYRMKRSFELTFAPGILSQFCLSLFILCISIYELTANRSDKAQLFLMLLYLVTMMVELMFYCWFGNEVFLKSMKFGDVVGSTDWIELQPVTQKGLLIMMMRTSSPIMITCGPFIKLTTSAFTSILKLSYSVFNVMQQSN